MKNSGGRIDKDGASIKAPLTCFSKYVIIRNETESRNLL